MPILNEPQASKEGTLFIPPAACVPVDGPILSAALHACRLVAPDWVHKCCERKVWEGSCPSEANFPVELRYIDADGASKSCNSMHALMGAAGRGLFKGMVLVWTKETSVSSDTFDSFFQYFSVYKSSARSYIFWESSYRHILSNQLIASIPLPRPTPTCRTTPSHWLLSFWGSKIWSACLPRQPRPGFHPHPSWCFPLLTPPRLQVSNLIAAPHLNAFW